MCLIQRVKLDFHLERFAMNAMLMPMASLYNNHYLSGKNETYINRYKILNG